MSGWFHRRWLFQQQVPRHSFVVWLAVLAASHGFIAISRGDRRMAKLITPHSKL
ncbi:hypothetical protein RISK_000788 [Rhodopirellula islandica]|uniref:Transmembrane protein n=1 Tax=Rhodopirellula islandica TaxID=595434 RepID=A0A0J1BKE8_RHOIS|nr:hypothetical protein RISK_000788 [Rhodopirellula islandica]